MNRLSPQRRKVVVMAAAVGSLSGVAPLLLKNHPRLGVVWVGCMLVALIFTMVHFGKLRREESR